MELPNLRDRIDHPAFGTTAATVLGYALLLLAIFGVLFVLPWLLLGFF